MIKNYVTKCTSEEILNNINIMLSDGETLNIFLDGNQTPTMTETIKDIYKHFNIERNEYSEYSFMQAFDFLSDIFDLTPLNNINKVNIIVNNLSQHNCMWTYNGTLVSDELKYKIYKKLCDYFENEVIGTNAYGSRKCFDVYLCEDDFDIEEMKSKVNYPSKYEVMERILGK